MVDVDVHCEVGILFGVVPEIGMWLSVDVSIPSLRRRKRGGEIEDGDELSGGES